MRDNLVTSAHAAVAVVVLAVAAVALAVQLHKLDVAVAGFGR